ncbi:hypothetical protein [uncultured Pelagimonas sp.]|nr:hypothetical protein [uncultured Pelagimonas sp.]
MSRFHFSPSGLFTLAVLIGSATLATIGLPYAFWKLVAWVNSLGPWWPL